MQTHLVQHHVVSNQFPDAKLHVGRSPLINQLNYPPLNALMSCLKWGIPKHTNLSVNYEVGYPRSSCGEAQRFITNIYTCVNITTSVIAHTFRASPFAQSQVFNVFMLMTTIGT